MLKVGVLGAGHLGKIHLKLLKELKADYEVIGFYDPDRENAKKVATFLSKNKKFKLLYPFVSVICSRKPNHVDWPDSPPSLGFVVDGISLAKSFAQSSRAHHAPCAGRHVYWVRPFIVERCFKPKSCFFGQSFSGLWCYRWCPGLDIVGVAGRCHYLFWPMLERRISCLTNETGLSRRSEQLIGLNFS